MWGATSLSWGYCTSQRPPGRGHRGHGRPWSSPPATQGHSEAAPYTRLPVGRRQGPGLGSGDGKAQAAAPTRGQGQVSRKAAAAASTSWFHGRGQSPGKGQPGCGRRAGRTLQKRPRPRAGGASQVLPKARESWPGGPAPPAPPARPQPQWLSGAERLLSASLGGLGIGNRGCPQDQALPGQPSRGDVRSSHPGLRLLPLRLGRHPGPAWELPACRAGTRPAGGSSAWVLARGVGTQAHTPSVTVPSPGGLPHRSHCHLPMVASWPRPPCAGLRARLECGSGPQPCPGAGRPMGCALPA